MQRKQNLRRKGLQNDNYVNIAQKHILKFVNFVQTFGGLRVTIITVKTPQYII